MTADITLADAITGLIAEKRAVGYKYATEARVLARFEGFCRGEFPGLGAVTQVSVEAWVAAARGRGVKPATCVQPPVLGSWPCWLGRGSAGYVLPETCSSQAARYAPHIYTDQELAALFARTDRCHYCSQAPFRTWSCRSCSGRSTPAVCAAPKPVCCVVDDVDIDAGVLQIRDAKGGKSASRVPSPALRVRLADYHDQLVGRPGWDWFFRSRAREPLTLGNVYHNFRRFLWQAGISHGGPGHGPRVHDLRTTFAVNNLRSWFAQGRDVGALLPVLQTYLGHSSIADTAYYLHLTAESYPDITARVQQAIGDVVPPVTAGPCDGH